MTEKSMTEKQKSCELVQYVFLRKDLPYNTGEQAAQACHAVLACAYVHRDEKEMQDYLANTKEMKKVILGVSGESEMRELSEMLGMNKIKFYLWVEKPEDKEVALAVVPMRRRDISPLVRGYRLLI
ncbi:MAG: peptidyl-tRNA hydrolase, PTH2 family [Amphiamblys sp. WSBS2006]|nr:MAG: peptidyl-tRNA hydrolase, PTH2 family [Amphiamblys sp. WSBS2006]